MIRKNGVSGIAWSGRHHTSAIPKLNFLIIFADYILLSPPTLFPLPLPASLIPTSTHHHHHHCRCWIKDALLLETSLTRPSPWAQLGSKIPENVANMKRFLAYLLFSLVGHFSIFFLPGVAWSHCFPIRPLTSFPWIFDIWTLWVTKSFTRSTHPSFLSGLRDKGNVLGASSHPIDWLCRVAFFLVYPLNLERTERKKQF